MEHHTLWSWVREDPGRLGMVQKNCLQNTITIDVHINNQISELASRGFFCPFRKRWQGDAKTPQTA